MIEFGEKIDSVIYQLRIGCYAVIFNQQKDQVLTVKTNRGSHFLPGGGLESNETQKECLKREILEETGYECLIDSFIGNAKRYFQAPNKEFLLSDGYFYLANIGNYIQEPVDDDHYIKWIDIAYIEKYLFHEHHIWAIKEGLIKGQLSDSYSAEGDIS